MTVSIIERIYFVPKCKHLLSNHPVSEEAPRFDHPAPQESILFDHPVAVKSI